MSTTVRGNTYMQNALTSCGSIGRLYGEEGIPYLFLYPTLVAQPYYTLTA